MNYIKSERIKRINCKTERMWNKQTENKSGKEEIQRGEEEEVEEKNINGCKYR